MSGGWADAKGQTAVYYSLDSRTYIASTWAGSIGHITHPTWPVDCWNKRVPVNILVCKEDCSSDSKTCPWGSCLFNSS